MTFRHLSGIKAALAISAVLLTSCRKAGEDHTSKPATRPQVAGIAKATVAAYWKSVQAGAMRAADEDQVDLLWTGPDAETNHTQQAGMIDNMVNRGVAGIVLAPTNVDALVRPVESAVKRGVPVVLMDSTLHSTAPSGAVATDNEAAGRQAAAALVAAIGDKKTFGGKVIMLRFLEGSGSTGLREKGFSEGVAAAGLTLAGDAYTKGSGSSTDAADTADALLRRFIKDNVLQVDGIFAANEPSAIGMLRKIQQFKAQGVAIAAPYVGFDAQDTLLAGIRSGDVAALVTQDPKQIGYQAVKMIDRIIKGEKVEPVIATPTATITKANIDSPTIQAIVSN